MLVPSKSKLRQKDPPALGPKYSGVRVSRAALDDSSDSAPEHDSDEGEDVSEDEGEDSEEYDDPDTADLERDNIIDDEEIDSDEAFGEGEEEIFKKKGFTFKDSKAVTNGRSRRPVAADFMSGSELDGPSDSDRTDGQLAESEAEEDGTDDEDGSSAGEDSEDESEDEHIDGMDDGDSQSDLRKRFAQAQKAIVPTISQAAKEEAQKGVAARQQRRMYDSLLNLRIRLQKGLVAINSLGEATGNYDSDGKEVYEAAEEAAIKLWTTIDGFRASLLPDQKTGQKRKRHTFDADTPTEALWEHMQSIEEDAAAKRKEVLEKWANKVKHTVATISKERQLGGAAQSVVAALEGQLVSSAERLVKRTRVPRSCAPTQAARKVAEDPSIYDDADFYQLLLKELVDQRSSDAGAGANGANGDVPTVRWTAVSEAKTRKLVDRRASKGRKLRFTVHEKLQNFMAPEDRRSWEEEAIDRLFGTLFGQRMGLKEDAEDEGEGDEAVAQEEGLKLFRN